MKSTKFESILSVIGGICLIAISFLSYFMYPNYRILIIPIAAIINTSYYFYFTSDLGFKDSFEILLMHIFLVTIAISIIAFMFLKIPFSIALILKLLTFAFFTLPLAPFLTIIFAHILNI